MAIGSILQIYPFDFKPSAPPSGQFIIYVKTDNTIYIQDSSGIEYAFGSTTAITQLSGEATGVGPGNAVVTLSNSAVIGKVLTSFTAGPNSPVLATDTILQAFQKLQAQVTASSSSAITALTGDVSATGPGSVTATVNSVGGSSAANIHSAELAANAATAANTASTIVKRDASGNFSANNITASLLGNATTSTNSTNFTGSLSGDVTGTQSSTVVATVGGKTASDIASAVTLVDAATSVNTASTLVERDASGNFAASTITANLTGNVTGNVSGTASNVTGVVAVANGGTNSSAALSNNRIMQSSGGAIIEASAITPHRALISNVNGIPTQSVTTDTELSYVSGVTSSIQTQINSITGSGITALTGDVSATGPGSVPATVNSVGGSSAANIHSAELAANAATSSNTPNTIVKRDGSGNFSAGTITAALTGAASANVLKAGDTMSGELFITAAGTGLNVSNNVVVGGTINATGTITGSNLSGTNTGDVTVTDTNSIDLTLTGQNIQADLKLSSDAADANNLKATTTIHSGAGAGLHVEYQYGTPVQIGTSNATGGGNGFSLFDHVHAVTWGVIGGLIISTYTIGTNAVITAADSLVAALGKLQAQINAIVGSAVTSLTGDVTGTGPGATATTIAVGAVTDTKGSLSNKPAVTVVATTNQTLSGTPTIDGQATTAGTSIVLLSAQTTGSQNGPWVVQSGAWTRPTWFPSGGTTQSFQFITTLVRLGTVYGGSTWRQTTAAPVTIDTTSTTWVVTPQSGNFKSTYVVGPQTGSAEVDLNFANSNVGTLAWNPSSTFKLTIPPTQGGSGTYLSNDGSGILSWTNPLVNIDGGSPSSNYTASQLINGGTP